MDKTVFQLKVGDRLILGKYGVSNDAPNPIVWLKGNSNCDFITECALDYVSFDAAERAHPEARYTSGGGNPNYQLSNIFQFLNSDAEEWYHPQHDLDQPPPRYRSGFGDHFGFLYYFEEYELESLAHTEYETNAESRVQSCIRLPFISDITGGRLDVFKKRGVRPKGVDDMLGKYGGNDKSYVDFWLGDQISHNKVAIVNRSAYIDSRYPTHSAGLRPMCTVDSRLPVESDENGVYHIKPFQTSGGAVCTDEELYGFLGIRSPH